MAKGAVAVAKNGKKIAASASHPPYFEMISEAIATLKERTGSSQPAIAKFIEENYRPSLPPNFRKLLSVQLKKFTESERLVKIKNSYKLPSTKRLSLTIKEDQKSETKEKKAVKMKRLSQVKTPEALKKAKKEVVKTATMKRLSQVKTPDGLKKKKNSKTPGIASKQQRKTRK